MPLSSGFSIQRNELVQIEHRNQTEYHIATGSNELPLKSMIDFTEKNWEWDIRIKSVKRDIVRTSGNNFSAGTGAIQNLHDEVNYWESKEPLDIYKEGDISIMSQSVEFDQTIGTYGGLRFKTEYIPVIGSSVQVTYREHSSRWTGDGGLLHRLATDLCVHPYDVPELRVISSTDWDNTTGSENFDISLNEHGYLDDVVTDDIIGSAGESIGVSTQRTIKQGADNNGYGLWRVVRDDSYKFHGKIVDAVNGVGSLFTKSSNALSNGLLSPVVGTMPLARDVHSGGAVGTILVYMPYIQSDLGNGEFIVSIDGRVLPSEYWYCKSTSTKGDTANAKRYSEFYFVGKVSTDAPWVVDANDCIIEISFRWKYSTLKPYGALVGPDGFSPEQQTVLDDHSFSAGDASANWQYWEPGLGVRGRLQIKSPLVNSFSQNDIILLEYGTSEGLGFDPAFKLIYPPTDNTSKYVVESSCDQISNMFVVESTGAVDLLSKESQYGLSQHIPGGLKSQKWRIKFEWVNDTYELKVNVATPYQIMDDGFVSHGQERGGVEQKVFRLPGELCDVYHEPSISRHSTTTSVKNKSHWFKRSYSKTLTNIKNTYPISYRLTTTNHGVSLFLWEQASLTTDTNSSWFVVQRHVDQTTGQPDISGKTPLHCVYSPSKRIEKFEGLQQYYASSDVSDLSPAPIVYDASGSSIRNPSKTYWVSNESVFDGYVNSLDLFGKGYGTQLTPGANPSFPLVNDLSVSIVSDQSPNGYGLYWSRQSLPFELTFTSNGALSSPTITSPGKDITRGISGTEVVVEYAEYVVNITGASSSANDAYLYLKVVAGKVESVDFTTIPSDSNGSAPSSPTSPGTGYTANESLILDFAGAWATDQTTDWTGLINPVIQNRTITGLTIQGFGDLPRTLNNNLWTINGVAEPSWYAASISGSSTSFSGQHFFTTLTPERMSPYGDLSNVYGSCVDQTGQVVTLPSSNGNSNNESGCIAEGRAVLGSGWLPGKDYTWISPTIPSATIGTTASDWKSHADSLIDILSPHDLSKKNEIEDSMVISLNDIIVDRDSSAYILSYEEWVKSGDPSTIPRFLSSLDYAGVNTFGSKFKLPMYQSTTTEILSTYSSTGATIPAGTPVFQGGVFGTSINWSDIIGGTSFSGCFSNSGLQFKSLGGKTLNELHPVNTYFTGELEPSNLTNSLADRVITHSVDTFVLSGNDDKLRSKLPGDVVFGTYNSQQITYYYDFENKTLYFNKPPEVQSKLSISIDNFSSLPGYTIKVVEDKDFITPLEDSYASINRFVVRESDVLKPWDYHLSATKHSIDSYSIINPYEQLSITDERNFVFSFPTQLTTQRFYYPTSELDMICISSADFSSQGGHIEIDKYDDSDGTKSTIYSAGGVSFDPTNVSSGGGDFIYSGQIDQAGDKYYWKRNIRKYEGMSSTLPNGNGMRLFMIVTGSSIRHSDVEKRAII
jgi:hypothetical protein